MTTKTKRVALYARVSTANHGQDPEVQLIPLRQYVIQKGWTVVDEFVDVGESGAKSSRPELDRMMHMVRGGKIQGVLVYRFDRFGRSVSHLLQSLEEFKKLNVDFVSISEAVDTSTSLGQMVFTFISAVAQFEREMTISRINSGIQKARAEGKHCGRPRKHVDTRAARALLDQGHSLRSVASMLQLPRTTLKRKLEEET